MNFAAEVIEQNQSTIVGLDLSGLNSDHKNLAASSRLV